MKDPSCTHLSDNLYAVTTSCDKWFSDVWTVGEMFKTKSFVMLNPQSELKTLFCLHILMSVTKHSHTHTTKKNVVMNIHKGYKCSLYKHGYFQLVTFLDGFEKKYTLVWNVLEWEKSLRLLKFEINSTKCLLFGLFSQKMSNIFMWRGLEIHIVGRGGWYSLSAVVITFGRQFARSKEWLDPAGQ